MSEQVMNSQNKTYVLAKQQQGVVLFVALIALVVMSLAAVALIRSVDTSTLLAGNLAAKQSATTSGDSGMETAITWMAAANLADLNADITASGYYADLTQNPMNVNWATGSLPATSNLVGNIDANGQDLSGNTTRYIVQRMCRPGTALPSAANCLFGPPTEDVCSKRGDPEVRCPPLDPSPMYRITARVIGVKNTISFIQAYLY